MQLVNEGMDPWEVATERETIEQCKQRNKKGIVIVSWENDVLTQQGSLTEQSLNQAGHKYCETKQIFQIY